MIESTIEYAWGTVGHLTGVMNSDELRAAHQAIQPAVVAATTKVSQSAVIYKATQEAAAADADGGSLDEAQRRVLAASLRSMQLSGVGLEGKAKERFNANRVKLSELSTAYSNNVLDATKAFSLVITDSAEVEGLPPSARAAAAQAATKAARAETGEEGGAVAEATAEEGPWRIGLDIPSYLPAMQHIKSAAVRKERRDGAEVL